MAHFAKVKDNMVIKVVVVHDDNYFSTFIDDSPGEYIQCSYNTSGGIHWDQETNLPSEDQSKALRKNYPGCGWYYDTTEDAFYAPQPYPSWSLNPTSFLWEAPTSYPEDGGDYIWNELIQEWILAD